MVQCPECNSEVSDNAKFCPKCRTPLKSNEDNPKNPKIATDKKGGFNPILLIAIVAVVAGTGGTGLALIGGGIVADATVAAVAWNVANAAAECLVYAGATYLLANASGRTSARQMQRQVLKGQAPDEVDRVDGKHRNIPNSKDHIHFKDNTAINYDGTISHEGHGKPKLTRKIKEWITQNGWRYE